MADSDMAGERSRTIRRLKLLYFFQAVGPSSWGRYASLYYDSIGLTPAQVGYITGAMPSMRALCMPVWGFLADRASTKKSVALLTQSCAAVILLLLAVPGIATPRDQPHDGRFTIVLAISIGSAAFASSGVLDAYALDALGETERAKFGEIRMWSAVSWGICNPLMGLIADLMGSFLENLVIFAACTAISVAILAILIPKRPPQKERLTTTLSVEYYPRRSLLARCAVAGFFAELIVFGAAMGLVERLLFVYVVEVLDGSYSLCGATVLFTVLLEIPTFAHASSLISSIGHDAMFCIALACYCPRVIGYTMLTTRTKNFILLLELLHGPTYGLMFAAAVDRAARLAPPGYAATYQTLQNATRACLGAGLGATLGGYFWTDLCDRQKRRPNCKRGAVRVFGFAAVIVVAVLCLHLMCLLISRLCRDGSAADLDRDVARDDSSQDVQHELLSEPLLSPTAGDSADEARSSCLSSSSCSTVQSEVTQPGAV